MNMFHSLWWSTLTFKEVIDLKKTLFDCVESASSTIFGRVYPQNPKYKIQKLAELHYSI